MIKVAQIDRFTPKFQAYTIAVGLPIVIHTPMAAGIFGRCTGAADLGELGSGHIACSGTGSQGVFFSGAGLAHTGVGVGEGVGGLVGDLAAFTAALPHRRGAGATGASFLGATQHGEAPEHPARQVWGLPAATIGGAAAG